MGVIAAVQLAEGSEDVGDLWDDDALSEGNDWADTDESLEPDGEGEVVDPEEPDDASGDDDSDYEG